MDDIRRALKEKRVNKHTVTINYICLPYTYIHTYTYIHIHTYVRTYVHTYIHTYIHTYLRTYLRTYIHIYIYTYIHTYVHVCLLVYIKSNCVCFLVEGSLWSRHGMCGVSC